MAAVTSRFLYQVESPVRPPTGFEFSAVLLLYLLPKNARELHFPLIRTLAKVIFTNLARI